ncbi:MAG: YeeE/YedE family protein [Hyphomicrobiales bacterium]|nr:YeeE/YedE family protein [Hyphomicrobiales bacterium]
MTHIAPTYVDSFIGGILIGLSSLILLLLNGRIAGISGIFASLFGRADRQLWVSLAFVIGLILGPLLFRAVLGDWPLVRIPQSFPLIIVAGLLVGFGTRLGSGCTSGHGVTGLARLSPRSMAAVAVFMIVAVLTVYLKRAGGWI